MNQKSSSAPATRRPQRGDAALHSPAFRRKCGEILAQLPQVRRLVQLFGELHEILDEHDQVADFDTYCQIKFGVVPELLLEATDRL